MYGRMLSAEEWLAEPEYRGLVVMDPDGWDRSSVISFVESWEELISQETFDEKISRSTCVIYPE